jgi:carboxyl-terminal processing protease
MKTLAKIVLFFLLTLTLYNCTKEDEIPVDVEINDFIWKGMNAYYLYQDQIPDLSDRRFNSQPELNSYLKGFTVSNELFTGLLLDPGTTDTKSTLLEDSNILTTPSLRISNTNGVEFGIIAQPGSPTNVIGYVISVLSNSDAATKSIARGEFFYAVDNTQLTRDNFQTLLISGNASFELSMADFDGTTITSNSKKVALTKTGYTHSPIAIVKNFTNTGYLLYNNDFSTNYIDNLNAAFLNFKNLGTNQLILDLRYNVGGGSFAKTVSQIASMITGQFANQTLIKEKWNAKAQPWFELNQPDSLITKFPTKINSTTINSLQLTDFYIILNGSSSAVELLVNSLKGYINVHVVNSNQTAGNNTGAITLYNSIDYDSIGKSANHTFALQPIVLEFLNKDDQTYESGFNPEMTICNQEDILDMGVLGETTDPLLNRVLNFINSGSPSSNTVCNPNNFEFLYNSIRRQRIIDTGVFIKQNLPNTN